MRLARFSLAGAMLAVILVACDVSALQQIYNPIKRQNLASDRVLMSFVPMLNVLAILGYRSLRRGGLSSRPFLRGFFIAGLLAVLGHVGCYWLFPETMSRLYRIPSEPLYRFTMKYLPWNSYVPRTGLRMCGLAFWRYTALLAIPYSLPQFVVATLGGLMVKFMNWRRAAPLETNS